MLNFCFLSPKRHILARNHVVCRITRENRFRGLGCECGPLEEPEKKKPSKHLWYAISRIRGKETLWGIVIFWVDIRDIITYATFGDDRLRGLGVARVEFPISPLTCVVALTTLLHYRASVWWLPTVVKVVLWSRFAPTWRSQVGANPIPIPTPRIWRYLGIK